MLADLESEAEKTGLLNKQSGFGIEIHQMIKLEE